MFVKYSNEKDVFIDHLYIPKHIENIICRQQKLYEILAFFIICLIY